MNLATLKTELTTDPLARGYAGMSDEAAAASLNAQDRTPSRDSLTGGELAASVVKAEYSALSAADKAYFNMLVPSASLPLTATLKSELGTLFSAGTATRTNLVALLKRTGTRGEELGIGYVTPSDIANAKRS